MYVMKVLLAYNKKQTIFRVSEVYTLKNRMSIVV